MRTRTAITQPPPRRGTAAEPLEPARRGRRRRTRADVRSCAGESSNRRGAAYVITLGVTLLAAVLGLAGLKVVRLTRLQSERVFSMSDAQLLARAALDMALLRIETDPDWRQKMSDGTWSAGQTLSEGHMSFAAFDPVDGDLTDSDTDPVIIVGTGEVGQARQKLQMQVNFDATGFTSLKSALHAGGNILVSILGSLTADAAVSSNASIDLGLLTVNADVQAVGSILGLNILGSVTAGIEPREMPDASSVFSFYAANGTSIPLSSLPLVSGVRQIENTVLAPGYNPFSSGTNASGIYVIDCQNVPVRIANSRILGTLVLLNAGGGSRVESKVNWEPAVSNYPSILVQGGIDLKFDGTTTLVESSMNVNLNPSGAPHDGQSDANLDDSYASSIDGLVYATGQVTFKNSKPRLRGVIIAGTMGAELLTNVQIVFDSNFYYNPPPGFRGEPKAVVEAGSFRRVVDE